MALYIRLSYPSALRGVWWDIVFPADSSYISKTTLLCLKTGCAILLSHLLIDQAQLNQSWPTTSDLQKEKYLGVNMIVNLP